MAKTGQKFDINPETFTLANIFAMELQRYHDTIGEIVTMASKEMGIEKVMELKFILLLVGKVQCWKKMNLSACHAK